MEQNFHVTRGDTTAFNLQFVDYQGDLSEEIDSMFFTVKETINGDVLFQKELGDGISALNDRLYVVRIAPEDTANIEIGAYYYDFQVTINGDVFTLLKGVFDVTYDVTN